MEFPTSSNIQQQSDVPVYCSSDSEPESQEEPCTKRTRKGGLDWIFVKKFVNFDEAQQFLRDEKIWTARFTHTTEEGKKQYYRCNKVKYRGPQCAAQIYLLFESNSDAVLLYRRSSDHDHEIIGTKNDYGITQETKDEINKLYALHLKPKAILARLSEINGIKVPSKKQLNNYLSDRRRVVYGPSTISLGELEQWLINKSEIPEDDNEPYVIYYYVYEEDDNTTFRFAIGTKSLLKLATLATNLHADATYKLTWQGFPVLVVGTTDKAKRFHPLCMAISSSERKEDFVMLFDALKRGALTLYDFNIEPKALICDAAKSIQNAFQEIFGTEATIKMCWAHAKKNIQKKVEKLVEKKKQKELLDDIDLLHSATSPTLFQRALTAFLHKHAKEEQFISYFKQEWVSLNPNWYLGSAEGSPVTNNALESFNRTIKDSHTLRERLPLSRFISVATNMVKEWSKDHKPETFKTLPPIELKDWTLAYQWAKLDKNVKLLESDSGLNTYIVRSSTASDMIFTQDWDTFDGYKKNAFAYWRVALPTQQTAWVNGKCTCPIFFKNYMCKHIIGLAIRLKYVAPPAQAKSVPIGQKRKRGRPAKARPALIIQ